MYALPIHELTREIAQRTGCPDVRLDGPISVRDNSVVYRARMGDAARQDAAVKCCLEPDTRISDAVLARRQYDALRRVNQVYRNIDPQFAVPEPLFFSERYAAYGMSWIEGETLTAHMSRKEQLHSLGTAFRETGQWLGTFHRAGAIRSGQPDIASKIAYLETMRNQPVMHPSFERGIHLLRSSVASSKPAQISWLHGDCKTDNFMLSRGRVYGIDIHVEHENAIEHDLAQFLNNVALQTLRLRFRHLKPIAPALTDAFMSGYRSAGPEVSARLLHWIRLWSAISYWHSSVAEHRPAWATRWVLNRMFSALVGELIAAQGQAESDRIKP